MSKITDSILKILFVILFVTCSCCWDTSEDLKIWNRDSLYPRLSNDLPFYTCTYLSRSKATCRNWLQNLKQLRR